MGILYKPHVCPFPNANAYPPGTIWQCEECEKKYKDKILYGEAAWYKVSWWTK